MAIEPILAEETHFIADGERGVSGGGVALWAPVDFTADDKAALRGKVAADALVLERGVHFPRFLSDDESLSTYVAIRDVMAARGIDVA